MLNDKLLYHKPGDMDNWIYFATNKKWTVFTGAAPEANTCAGSACTEVGLAHPAAAKAWRVAVAVDFVPQPVEASMMVCRSLFSCDLS